jgi:hypothetical protein
MIGNVVRNSGYRTHRSIHNAFDNRSADAPTRLILSRVLTQGEPLDSRRGRGHAPSRGPRLERLLPLWTAVVAAAVEAMVPAVERRAFDGATKNFEKII